MTEPMNLNRIIRSQIKSGRVFDQARVYACDYMDTAIRVSICSWATTGQDIELSVQAFVDARNKVLSNV